jgi:hypothetical protein
MQQGLNSATMPPKNAARIEPPASSPPTYLPHPLRPGRHAQRVQPGSEPTT